MKRPRVNQQSVLALAVAFVAFSASAATLVSEGVTFASNTGLYTYRYAIDNRAGTSSVNELGVLLVPKQFLFLPALQHTSPPGWFFAPSIGFISDALQGAFQEWQSPDGVRAGEYLSGFSITTSLPPRNDNTLNYFLFNRVGPTDSFFDVGTIEGPSSPIPIPAISPIAKLLMLFSLALVGIFGISKLK